MVLIIVLFITLFEILLSAFKILLSNCLHLGLHGCFWEP